MKESNCNGNASIIHLFEKMDSNITNFKASVRTSPERIKRETSGTSVSGCSCTRETKQRNLEKEFFRTQKDSVRKVAELLEVEGNHTIAKLLNFMSQYCLKIQELLSQEVLCMCKRRQIEQHKDLTYKITFLREENHKFFKMIEEKSEECDNLRMKIDSMQTRKNSIQGEDTPIVTHFKSQMPFASALTQEMTSRVISSNSSRVSEFRHIWPELTLPMGDVGHRRYFEGNPGQNCINFASREVLKQKSFNNPLESTFRKPKPFDNLCQQK